MSQLGPLNSVTDYAQLGNQISTLDDAEGIRQAAQQFESIFVSMWLKAARAATAAISDGGIFSGNEMQLRQDMFDQQMSLHLSQSGGIGLAPVIVRQLGGEPEVEAASQQTLKDGSTTNPATFIANARDVPITAKNHSQRYEAFTGPEDFVQRIGPEVARVAEETGLPFRAVLGQAALETGWGRSILQSGTGESSHNLFGIKQFDADEPGVDVVSKEFELGRWVERTSTFKTYDSFADSVQDYADLIRNSPIYQSAVAVAEDASAYIREVAQAGYATDPNYAEKVDGVMNTLKRLLD